MDYTGDIIEYLRRISDFWNDFIFAQAKLVSVCEIEWDEEVSFVGY